MFSKIAKFFIENSKLTIVLVLITLLTWIWSYFIIPKQYNPTIVVPAFQVIVPSPSLNNDEVSRLIVSPLENKIMELEWIDEVYWIANDNYGWVMVKFQVWVDKEKAKIRLIQKLNENLDLKPLWVENPIIKTIDPDELPQITYAISYSWNDIKNDEDVYIYLKQIAKLIENKVKTIENLTTIDIVWWYKNNIIIDLDISKIEARNTDIMQVYDVLQKNNLSLPAWDIWEKNKIFINVEWKVNSIDNLKKLVIWNYNWSTLYLEDIAEIKYWVKRIDKISNFSDETWTKKAVFIWFWKAIWTNWVFITDKIIEKIEEIKKDLPNNIELTIIQNEWETARNATNMLLINLAQSVIIVFIVLYFYLWAKDAFNTAVSIPLTLSLVFLLALIFWDNINRITLFALILVLWMLVDNSTVVVENISRHLKERINTWKTKLEAVLEWTQEVWVWVILSTLTRLLAFGAMFAVWWMMWEYMWPIPKFAIMALLISLIIAFSINPWLSYMWAKDITQKETGFSTSRPVSNKKFDIRKYYLWFMKKFINQNKKSRTKRKVFKLIFWLTLFTVILWPIYAWIFKARMLPKSNQNQVYLWVDWPREWSSEKMLQVSNDINKFLFNEKLPENLDIVKNVSITIGQPFMSDFANLFRWWWNRIWENQLSARINLISKEENENRLSSEEYVIKVRPLLRKYLLEKYPDVKIRLLEDPPWPPVRATFLAKIKWNAWEKNIDIFRQKIETEVNKIKKEQWIVDIWNSNSTTYKKTILDIDHESVSRAGLSTKQVAYTLAIAINWMDISLIQDKNSLEPTNIFLWVNSNESETLALLDNIVFTNSEWKKIPLSSISTKKYSFVWNEINTDKREKTTYIYGEMWDNSLIYPVIKLFVRLMDKEFVWEDYKVVSWSPYYIEYKWLKDGKTYILEWGWEWELTMDTFRDLWIAMWLSLLAIYFLLVWQFASFWIAWIIMISFLLGFFWVFPGFSLLYLIQNEYFSATSMIWVIALAWIVVGNAIILIDYLNVLKKNWITIEDALLKAWYIRFAPIILTSLTTVFGAATIIWDPVWSGLAWSIIWWLFVSSILTLIVIPIFYYDSQKNEWDECMKRDKMVC